jgi:hypothetical protein
MLSFWTQDVAFVFARKWEKLLWWNAWVLNLECHGHVNSLVSSRLTRSVRASPSPMLTPQHIRMTHNT